MRAHEPDGEGYLDLDGVKLHYEVFGDGAPTLLLLPAWTIVQSRCWKAQVPYLARHFRVVTYDGPFTSTEGWAKYNRHYWLAHYRDFVEFFAQCLPEPHSTKQHEDNVGWGLETTPQVLLATGAASQPDEATIRRWCARVRSPVLVVHGDKDRICPLRSGGALARATGGSLVVLGGAGHLPHARDPVKVNLLIREFAAYLPARGAP
jgi:pimeloyl-ACP methyl ester carboxylesterase